MKKLAALMLAMTMSFTLAGCGSSGVEKDEASATPASVDTKETDDKETETSEKETYHFEIISKGFQSTYWQAVYKGAQDKMKELNSDAGYEKYTMNFVGPDSESDIAVQVQQFTSAVNAKPDAIGLAALDVDALLDSITSVQNENIPIIGFDSGVPNAPEGAVYANASTDNYKAGQLAADGLYDAVKDRIGDKQVRIGVVNQDATSESIINRGLGFIDQMIDHLTNDGYTVFVTGNEKYVGDSKESTGTEADANVILEVRVPSQTTTELCATEAGVILNEKDTIAIYGSNQVAAEGVVTANETLQVLGTGAENIIAVGFDSGTVLKAAVSGGIMYGAVTQAPVSIGAVLIELLAASASGETVENTDTGCQFYTAENIDSPEISQNLYD